MLSKLKSVQSLLSTTLARNTGWMLLGQGLRLIIQAVYFTTIARSLGVSKYGAFVGVVGLVSIFAPFGSLGRAFLIIKNVSRDKKQFSKSWGRALATTLVASSALIGVILLLSKFVLPIAIPTRLVMYVALSDLFAFNITEVCGRAFMAFDLLQWTAAINVFLGVSRLAAAGILVALHHNPTALQWGQFYLVSTCVVALASLGVTLVKLGTPTFELPRSFAEDKEGFYIALGNSAGTIYNDIDKTMLARLGTLEATGIYGAAYRLIDVSFTPVTSLLGAAYPNFWRVGVGGVAATLRYAKPLILYGLCYAVLVCIAVLAGAGIVPYVLGGDYRFTVEALRWLAILPVLRVVHYFLSDALAGAGHQGLKASIQISVAVFNVLINLWIIPAYSWRGAAWSSIASDTLLMLAIGAAVLTLSRRPHSATPESEALQARAEA